MFLSKFKNDLSSVGTIVSTIFLISIIFTGFIFALGNPFWSDGDELHYLVMTNSFIEDRDFNLGNNYDSKEYFTHHGFEVGRHVVISPVDGAERSWHNILLPIMVSPGYEASNIKGARMVVFFICILGLIMAIKLLLLLDFSKTISIFTAAVFFIQMPILAYSQLVYTDMIVGYFLLFGSYFVVKAFKANNIYWFIPASTIFGLILFLHIKMILIISLILTLSVLLFFYNNGLFDFKFIKNSFLRNRIEKWLDTRKLKLVSDKKTLIKLVTKVIISLLPFFGLLILFNYIQYRWFGVFSYDSAYRLFFEDSSAVGRNPIVHLLGLFFDGEYGLFVNAPALLTILPGIYLVFKYKKTYFFSIVLPVILMFIIQSAFVVWRSWGPPARYAIALLPVLLPAMAITISVAFKKLSGLVVIFGLFLISLIPTFALFQYNIYNRSGYPSNEPVNYYWKVTSEYFGFTNIQKYIYLDYFYSIPSMRRVIIGLGILLVFILLGYFIDIIIKPKFDELEYNHKQDTIIFF